MTNEERKAALEAIIYAADEPATIEQLATALGEEKLAVQSSLDELVASYASEERGIEIRAVAGGYKMYTKPQHHDVVRRFIKSLRPPLRLTMPALETLAVISYKQPVTAPEIQEIRGVNTSGVLKTLLDKRLITTAGRKEVIGRPITSLRPAVVISFLSRRVLMTPAVLTPRISEISGAVTGCL